MNKATITKTLNKVQKAIKLSETNDFYKASLGFHRLQSLPQKVRNNFSLAANLKTNWNGRQANDNQINFLSGLTEQEFINWLTIN